MSATVVVGAADVVITPALGRAMGGYASRTAPADGTLDDLCCRVVVFAQPTTSLALVTLDLLYVPARLATAIGEAVAATLGTKRQNVLVSATHTHCGPAVPDSPESDGLFADLVEAAKECSIRALEARAEAHLYRASVPVAGLVRNRRDPEGPVETTAGLLVALCATSGDVLASIVSMACHPTVLEGGTTAYSRDFPGAVCDTLEAVCGGTAMFLQGFAGDANPVFEDHSAGDMRRLGRQVGARAADVVLSTRRATRAGWTVNLSRGQVLPVVEPSSHVPVEPIELAAELREVEVESKAPVTRDVATKRLAEARAVLAAASSPQERAAAAAVEAQWWIEELVCAAPPYLGMDLPPRGSSTLPVQVLTVGPGLRLIGLPGEPMAASARAVRQRLGDGVILVGYANRSASYLPPAEEFERSGYEVGSTRYARGTVERLVDVAVAMAAGSSVVAGT